MNDEIKEILDRLFVYRNENDEMKYQPEDILTIDDVWLLLDYITNLQEENDYLKDIVSNTELSNEIKKADKWSKRELYKINYQRLQANKRLREENERLVELCNKLEDYKSRNEKAIEYLGINEEILETCEIYDVNGIEVYKILKRNKWNEVERAYLDDKPIGSDKE